MLSSHRLQSVLSPSMDFSWPLPSLFYQQDLLNTNLSHLELMDKLQHDLLEETEPFQSGVSLYQLDQQGKHFAATLDAPGFSPEELFIRQVGRKLRISRKTEKKQEDEECCCSHTLQEFTQELDVPEEQLNVPKAFSCCLKLHIHPAKDPELEEETQQSVCSQKEDDKETCNGTQDKAAHMD